MREYGATPFEKVGLPELYVVLPELPCSLGSVICLQSRKIVFRRRRSFSCKAAKQKGRHTVHQNSGRNALVHSDGILLSALKIKFVPPAACRPIRERLGTALLQSVLHNTFIMSIYLFIF